MSRIDAQDKNDIKQIAEEVALYEKVKVLEDKCNILEEAVRRLADKDVELEQRIETRFNTIKSEVDNLVPMLDKLYQLALRQNEILKSIDRLTDAIYQLIEQDKKKKRWWRK